MTTHPCFFGLLLVAALTGFLAAAQTTDHRIYSNVEYNEEGGDLLGTELDLSINDQRVDGDLKIYQGGCASPVHVAGSLSGDELHVSGESEAYGKIQIAGTVRRNTLDGLLRLAKGRATEQLRLRKIGKPHC